MLWVFAIVLSLLLGIGGGWWYGNKLGFNKGYAKAQADAKVAAEADAKKAAEAANPFKTAETNPLENIQTNPLESVKFNPFQ